MKRRFGAVLLLVGLLALVPTVLAGGWATVVLDELPTDVRAGEPLTVGFMVMQHGVSPVHDLGRGYPIEPRLLATHKMSGQQITAEASPTETLGHFTVDVTFPTEGVWLWSITPEPFGGQELGLLTVYPPAERSLLDRIRALFRAPSHTSFIPATEPAYALMTPEAMGQRLFVVKSCAGCHDHQLNGVPNLTVYDPDPDFLRVWLRDPSAVKQGTLMPNLHLSDTEIEALIAFLEVRSQ